jgi:hypothetical protein
MNNKLYDIVVELNEKTNSFNDYEDILDRFPEFKQYNREIKLNMLLEENKICYEIENIKGSMMGTMGNDSKYIAPSKVAFLVDKMTFVIKNNTILNLTLKIKPLSTFDGKILNEILNSGIEIEAKLERDGNYFYINPIK